MHGLVLQIASERDSGNFFAADIMALEGTVKSINLLTMESLRRGGQQAALSLGFMLWSGDSCDRCAGIGICIPS